MTDDIIKINTDDYVKTLTTASKIETFELVDEDHPILKTVTTEFDFTNPPVDPNEFASSLVETCREKKAYGLAANQCGYSYRVFVMGGGDEYVAYYNPKIISSSEKESGFYEGCLSFPMLGLKIYRPESIDIEYQDFTGQKRTATYKGFSAHVFQHELDHLNGILFTQKAKPMSLKMGLKKRGKFNKLVKRYESATNKLSSMTD